MLAIHIFSRWWPVFFHLVTKVWIFSPCLIIIIIIIIIRKVNAKKQLMLVVFWGEKRETYMLQVYLFFVVENNGSTSSLMEWMDVHWQLGGYMGNFYFSFLMVQFKLSVARNDQEWYDGMRFMRDVFQFSFSCLFSWC